MPARLTGTPRRSLLVVTVAAVGATFLPLAPDTALLLVTGCFTLVYVLGTAAALRLLPPGWTRRGAGLSLVAVLALLLLTGRPALLSLTVAACGILYHRRTRPATAVSPPLQEARPADR